MIAHNDFSTRPTVTVILAGWLKDATLSVGFHYILSILASVATTLTFCSTSRAADNFLAHETLRIEVIHSAQLSLWDLLWAPFIAEHVWIVGLYAGVMLLMCGALGVWSFDLIVTAQRHRAERKAAMARALQQQRAAAIRATRIVIARKRVERAKIGRAKRIQSLRAKRQEEQQAAAVEGERERRQRAHQMEQLRAPQEARRVRVAELKAQFAGRDYLEDPNWLDREVKRDAPGILSRKSQTESAHLAFHRDSELIEMLNHEDGGCTYRRATFPMELLRRAEALHGLYVESPRKEEPKLEPISTPIPESDPQKEVLAKIESDIRARYDRKILSEQVRLEAYQKAQERFTASGVSKSVWGPRLQSMFEDRSSWGRDDGQIV